MTAVAENEIRPRNSVANDSSLNIAMLCLSVPGRDVSLLDTDSLTAFNKDDRLPELFYKSILELDSTDRRGALLRTLTITSKPDESRPVIPGSEMSDPVRTSKDALVAALICRRIDLITTNTDGDTALIVAAAKARSDIHTTGRGGATALHHAAQTADEETVSMLLHWKADPMAEDTDKRTPHWAVGNGKLQNARVLLDSSADEDKVGQTSQPLAEANRKSDLG